jgi:DNA invertase Pin-like site-specific DNA recombinase
MAKAKRAALYVRVSTDSQTVENQIRELRQVAERRGWEVVEVYNDAGISGAKGRNGRPGLDSMLKDASRRRFDVAMAWAIDRLGRSLTDLLHIIQHLEACGVDLYLDQQSIDTTTPMGKLVFQVTGAFAEFERTMIRQRVKAGLKRAVAQGVRLGRPKIDNATERKVRRQSRPRANRRWRPAPRADRPALPRRPEMDFGRSRLSLQLGYRHPRIRQRRPNTDCRNNPANACRPFLPVRASASTSLAITVKPIASSSSR